MEESSGSEVVQVSFHSIRVNLDREACLEGRWLAECRMPWRTQAVIRILLPKPRSVWGYQQLEVPNKDPSTVFRGNMALPTPGFWTSSPHNCETAFLDFLTFYLFIFGFTGLLSLHVGFLQLQ